MQRKLQRNIWKYTLLLIANKRVFVPIWGAYYLTIPGVTPKIIGTILLVGSLSGFLFEIPSGYASDKIGHKSALVISRIFMILSTVLFLVATDITFLIFGAVFLSASNAFYSGTGSAFMHETLRGLRREGDYTRIMGKMSSIGFAVPILFTIGVPFLVEVSYRLPFLVMLIIDVVGLFASVSLTSPLVIEEEIEEIGTKNFKQVVQEGFRLHYFSLALFAGVIGGTLFSVGVFRAPYQVFLEIPVIWYGVFFGIGRMCASLLLAFSGRIKEHLTMLSLYMFQLIAFSVLILVLGLVPTGWVVVLVFIVINAVYWGLHKIGEGYQLDVIASSKFKATLLSAGAQMSQIVAMISGFGFGFMIERFSYQYSFLYLSLLFFAVLFPLFIYITRQYKVGVYGNT